MSKYKIGQKVVPHSKTADGRTQGLENSVVWNAAISMGQPFLYVARTPLGVQEYQEYGLNYTQNQASFDYFHESDFEPYKE